ncbi:winged helix-turn-helix transcriptional regulator [Streptomyces pseudoechinosporeus]
MISNKWGMLVVILLGQRSYRFNELHRSVEGISQRVLTLTLRNLARDGLVSRTQHATIPPRVDYALTDLGRSLLGPLTTLNAWAEANQPDIRAARTRYDNPEPSAG